MSVLERPPGGAWTSRLLGAPAGDAGGWEVALWRVDTGAVAIAAAAGAVESPAGSGDYSFAFTLPATVGEYEAVWTNGATVLVDDDTVEVTASARDLMGSGIVAPGSRQMATITAPRFVLGSLTWRLLLDTDGSDVIAETVDGIDAVDVADRGDRFQLRYERPYTAPTVEGRYRSVWAYADAEHVDIVVVAAGIAALARVGDVAARLPRPLTDEEAGTVPTLLEMASAVIADAAGKTDGWVVALDPVPRILSGLCVELVCRALSNPQSLESFSETVGSYSRREAYRADGAGGGMQLTKLEELLVRRVALGRTTDSAKTLSTFREAEGILRLSRQHPEAPR